MTSDFESQDYTKSDFPRNLTADQSTGNANQPTAAINMLKRDRFELLSAYLDGEVTAAERRQVEEWLANEPEVQRLYRRLLKLRQELRTLPVPSTQQPVEQTVQVLFGRLKQRRKQAMVWGGAAIAALFVGALSGVLPTRQSWQVAETPESVAAPTEPLMVALNTPVVEIPKAAVAVPEKGMDQNIFPQNQIKQNLH